MKSKKKKLQSLSALKKKCWKLFSEWIRRRGTDEGGTDHCYTCGVPFHWKNLQAGHAIPGRHNAVLFDESICRPQCPRCNVWMGGRYEIFTTKLIKENGMQWWEEKLEGARRIVKYTRSDYEELMVSIKNKIEGLA